jgi:hypothetical protein
VYRVYTGGLEVVEAGAPAGIGVEERMGATVSVVGRAKEAFSAVEVARAGSERLMRSGRMFVGSACT